MHDFLECDLFLKDGFKLGAQVHELGVKLFEVAVQLTLVVAGTEGPVNGGEVLPLCELFVESPKDLHNGQRVHCHWIGKVSARRGHCAHYCDRALAVGTSAAAHSPRAFVELRQLGTQVRRVPLIGGHLGQSPGYFPQRLGPARGAVGHHAYVVAHIAEVLGERDPSVDGGLSGCDGHVGSVGHQTGPLHDGFLPPLHFGGQLREILKHFGHFVASFAAADVDNHLGIRVLRQRLTDARLSATEGAGYCAGSPQNRGKQGVEHSLSSQKRSVSGELLADGAVLPHWPLVDHCVLVLPSLELELDHLVADVVVPLRSHPRNLALRLRRNHYPVLVEQIVFRTVANHVAARYHRVHLYLLLRPKLPEFLLVQHRHIDSLRHKHAVRVVRNHRQRPLNSVEDLLQNARSQKHRQRLLRPKHRVPNRQSRYANFKKKY